jgi:TonB family protein
MSSVAKDNEILTTIPDHAAGSSTAAAAAPRPQPVALEVPVSVNGVRTVAGSEKREPFAETTKTVLIFGNGAVVRLSSSVAPGQLLFLTNEKTRKEVVCQVVKSKNYQNVSGYVELEFTEPVANFWGMRFPASATSSPGSQTPSASLAASAAATGAASVSAGSSAQSSASAPESEVKSKILNSPRVSGSTGTPHAAASANSSLQSPASSPQTESDGLRISSAPASGSSRSDKTSNVVEFTKVKASSASVAVPEPPQAPSKSSATPAKSILDVEEVKIPSWLEPLARNAAAASAALPEVEETQSAREPLEYEDAVEIEDPVPIEPDKSHETPARPVPTSSYGTHFLAEEKDDTLAAAAGGSDKKIFIVAVAAAILIVAGGGAWYVQQQRASSSPNSSAPVSTTAPTATGSESGTSTPSSSQSQPVSGVISSGNVTAESTSPTPAPSSSASANTPSPKAANYVDSANTPSSNLNKRLATVDSAPESISPAPKKSTLGAVSLSAPIVSKRQTQVRPEEALNLESTPNSATEGLGSGLVASSKQPVAPVAPRPVGGQVKVATLISSVAPLYPSNAKVQKVDGDVRIDALVGVNGRVSSMKVVSGPTLLRDPAMDAVRHWKYEPAQLDGKPVPMHLTVTVQFKLQ